MPAGEPASVISRAHAANAEVVRRTELVVVVSEQREEILKLRMRPLQCMQGGCAIASRKEMRDPGRRAGACATEQIGGVGGHRNEGAGGVLACRIAVAQVGRQWTVVTLHVGGEEQELAVLLDGKSHRPAKLVLPIKIGSVA